VYPGGVKSSGDPVLDLRALCTERPRSREDLLSGYLALGWGVPFGLVLGPASGVYVVLGDDGLYRPRDGTVGELVSGVLSGG